MRDAMAEAGISWSTWKRWRRSVDEGTQPDERVMRFVLDVISAHAGATNDLTERIASSDDPKHLLGLLQFRAEAPRRRHDQRRAYHEARIAKARADAETKGHGPPTVVIELPASLARPREG